MVYICAECVLHPTFFGWFYDLFLGFWGVKHWCPARTPTVGRCPEGNTVWQPGFHLDIETSNFVKFRSVWISTISMIHINIISISCKSSIPMWFCILTCERTCAFGCVESPSLTFSKRAQMLNTSLNWKIPMCWAEIFCWQFLFLPSHTSRSGLVFFELAPFDGSSHDKITKWLESGSFHLRLCHVCSCETNPGPDATTRCAPRPNSSDSADLETESSSELGWIRTKDG